MAQQFRNSKENDFKDGPHAVGVLPISPGQLQRLPADSFQICQGYLASFCLWEFSGWGSTFICARNTGEKHHRNKPQTLRDRSQWVNHVLQAFKGQFTKGSLQNILEGPENFQRPTMVTLSLSYPILPLFLPVSVPLSFAVLPGFTSQISYPCPKYFFRGKTISYPLAHTYVPPIISFSSYPTCTWTRADESNTIRNAKTPVQNIKS